MSQVANLLPLTTAVCVSFTASAANLPMSELGAEAAALGASEETALAGALAASLAAALTTVAPLVIEGPDSGTSTAEPPTASSACGGAIDARTSATACEGPAEGGVCASVYVKPKIAVKITTRRTC
jgi:hypothetical protein